MTDTEVEALNRFRAVLKRATPVLLAGLVFASCVGPERRAGETGSEAPTWIEPAGGTVKIGEAGDLFLQYRELMLAVDGSAGEASSADYLLLTGRKGEEAFSLLPRETKTVVPASWEARARKAGARAVKGLSGGQKLLFEKGEAFLFLQNAGDQDGDRAHYFLELDNGRTVLLTGAVDDPDSLRPFLYRIRDEGKEIDVGFFTASQGNAASAVSNSAEERLAQILDLLQPRYVVLFNLSPDFDENGFRRRLQEGFFSGQVRIARPGTVVNF